MAITKTLTQENGLTIHKVKAGVMTDETGAGQVFEAIHNAQPNELFIIEDSPRYYIAASTTSQYALVNDALYNIGYKDTSTAINTAQIDGSGLKLSCVAPKDLLNNNCDSSFFILRDWTADPEYEVKMGGFIPPVS